MKPIVQNLFAITMFVEDVGRAKAFYQDALGLNSVYEDGVSIVFDFGNTVVNLLNRSEADGLIGPAKVASQSAGSRFQLTTRVNDVDATCAELTSRGVALLNGPVDRPWGIRTACFADPDGHIWEIAQDLKRE